MRTTLTVDDDLLREIKRQARSRDVSIKEVIDEVLRAGLQALARPSPRRQVKSPVFHMGQPAQIDLDKALRVASALEDEEIGRKLALRK